MTNANHPKNQKQKAAQESSPDHFTATEHNPKPWVVVDAGQNGEEIAGEFTTLKDAESAVKNWYYQDEIDDMNIQIMRRRADGVLTTEY